MVKGGGGSYLRIKCLFTLCFVRKPKRNELKEVFTFGTGIFPRQNLFLTKSGYVGMSGLFRTYILSSNTGTCFFYLNNVDLRDYEGHGGAVKIRFGEDPENLTYGSISLTPVSEVPSKCVGVSSLFASKLGLEENETVLLSQCNVDSISSLQIYPEKEEDYVILLGCKSLFESYLLNQVSVVAEGQVLPLYVFSNISVNVEIGKLSVQSGYGRLEKFTEVTVLHPCEKPKKIGNTKYLENDNKEKNLNLFNQMYSQLNQLLGSGVNIETSNEEKSAQTFLKHLVEENLSENTVYKIEPSFLVSDSTFEKIKNKFIIVSNLNHHKNTFGPYCVKILAQVMKVINSEKEKQDHNEQDSSSLYTYVISLNNHKNQTAVCPAEVMHKLRLFVGQKLTIQHVKPNKTIKLTTEPVEINSDEEFSKDFSKRVAAMRENLKLTIINNFKHNYCINSLILGGPGSGKTFLLKNIINEFTNKFIFCKMVHCKSLRGKKIESLHRIWIDHLNDCTRQEPSLLLLDDLHALTYIYEEEGEFNKLYSNRVVDLISDMLKSFQRKFNISVIASATNVSQLSSLVSQHGPRLFQNVLTIPEMDLDERTFTLKSILRNKMGVSLDYSVDLDKLSSGTSGYTVQDLSDLVDKAIFNSHLRNETVGSVSSLCQPDLDVALSQSTPLNLRSVKLKQNIDAKWEKVGGMREPKKILTEIFSWPLKYPSVLESCPLRLQRGVLFYGAPGTGKTLLAGALANKCGLNFISVKGPEVLSKYVGASEEGVRNLFVQAEKTQPCLLFFDEFDSLAPKRGHDNTGVTDRVVNQLLTQLDGVESLNGVWMLAATSRPDLLDPALLRPGRLDKMVFCDLPNQDDRLSILEVLSERLSKSDDVSLLEVAEKTEGYTGADLQAILYNAQMSAIKEKKESFGKQSVLQINQIHLSKAVSEVKPSLSQREKMRYRIIYEKFLKSRMLNFETNNKEMQQRVTLA